jgi:hypothetical protein
MGSDGGHHMWNVIFIMCLEITIHIGDGRGKFEWIQLITAKACEKQKEQVKNFNMASA